MARLSERHHALKNFSFLTVGDSWVLDVALCNFLGIYLGMKTVTFFEGKTYDWTGMNRKKGLSGQVQRSIMLFTPASLDSYIWNPTSSPLRFFQCAFIVVLCLVFELNAFFFKYVLWIPPPHLLNHIRLALWFVWHCQHLDERILCFHNFREGNASDENGSERMASISGRSGGDFGRHKTRAWHVPGASAEGHALVLERLRAFHGGVADPLAVTRGESGGREEQVTNLPTVFLINTSKR